MRVRFNNYVTEDQIKDHGLTNKEAFDLLKLNSSRDLIKMLFADGLVEFKEKDNSNRPQKNERLEVDADFVILSMDQIELLNQHLKAIDPYLGNDFRLSTIDSILNK